MSRVFAAKHFSPRSSQISIRRQSLAMEIQNRQQKYQFLTEIYRERDASAGSEYVCDTTGEGNISLLICCVICLVMHKKPVKLKTETISLPSEHDGALSRTCTRGLGANEEISQQWKRFSASESCS